MLGVRVGSTMMSWMDDCSGCVSSLEGFAGLSVANVELGIPHGHHLPAESQISNGLVLDEEDLGLKNVPAGERRDEVVEERDVLGRERVTSWRQRADGGRGAALEEHRALIEVDRETGVGGDITVRVLVDDEVLHIVRSCDHHFLDAALDEVDDPHMKPASLGAGARDGREPDAIGG